MKKVFILFVVLFSMLIIYEVKAKDFEILGFGSLKQVIFSPDGTKLASCGSGGIFIWDIASGDTLFSIRENTGYVYTIAFSPDGTKIAGGISDSTAKIWDIKTGAEIGTILHKDKIRTIKFSPDGTEIATGGGRAVNIWNVNTQELVKNLSKKESDVYDIAYSPDGSKLAECNTVSFCVWNISSGIKIATLNGTIVPICLDFNPNGNQIAIGSLFHSIYIYELDSGKISKTLAIKGDTSHIYCLDYSPDGKTIVAGSYDNNATVWDIESGAIIHTFSGHTDMIHSVHYSPDGIKIVSGSEDNTIKLWDSYTEGLLNTLIGHTDPIKSINFNDNGDKLACETSGKKEIFQIWDLISTKLIKSIVYCNYNRYNSCLAYSSDETKFAVGGPYTGEIEIWDVIKGQKIKTITGHDSHISSISYSQDGNKIASSGDTIKIWDVNMGIEILAINAQSSTNNNLCFSPDGNILASGNNNRSIRIWDLNTGIEIRDLWENTSNPLSICFNPTGTKIAGGFYDDAIKIWDVNTGDEIQDISIPKSSLNCVTFSPDGNLIASCGSNDYAVQLWDVDSGTLIKSFLGHNSYISDITFSPDGTKLASGSADGTIRIWNIEPNAVKESTEEEGNTLSISPNPAGDFITVKIERWSPSSRWTPSGTDVIQIYNTLGEKVMAVSARHAVPLRINISKLPKGMYFVKADGETAKFVKM
ncbi:MAG: T9SS type A sorting domain-containing protein [bacterium]